MVIEPSSSAFAKGQEFQNQVTMDSPPEYSENGHPIAGPRMPSQEAPKMMFGAPQGSPSSDPKLPVLPHSQMYVPHKVNNPRPTTDQVHIFEPHGDITGTFHIDPSVPALDQSRRKKYAKGKSKEQPPHASFRSRKGAINLDLGTTGNVLRSPKANIVVSSRSGDITVNLLSTHSSRPRIGLEATSRGGTIIMFLPEDFVGVVHLNSRKGQLHMLPALQSVSKIVKNSDHEAIFMIGGHDTLNDQMSREASFCEATTRTGSIIVGLSGKDHYTPEVGFWKKIGNLFKGGSQSK